MGDLAMAKVVRPFYLRRALNGMFEGFEAGKAVPEPAIKSLFFSV